MIEIKMMQIEQLKDHIRSKVIDSGLSISEDAIDELIKLGTGAIQTVFQSVEKVSLQLSDAITIDKKPILVTHDFIKPLWNWRTSLSKPSAPYYKLSAAGDGNCLLTSLRMGIDLRSSTDLALQCIESNTSGADLDVEPCLSGEIGSPNHLENFVLRKLLVNWFLNPITNLNLYLDKNTITYEEGTELKTRPMTRGDIVVLETRFHTDGDIDMSPNEDATKKRNEIAEKYMRKMYRNGECGSTPMLIAFVHLSKIPCGVRIYQKNNNTLKIYADVCSPTYSKLPTESEDTLLYPCPFTAAPAFVNSDAKDEDMWIDNAESDIDESESAAESGSDAVKSESDIDIDQPMEPISMPEQNFIRLLFSAPSAWSRAAGHYDLLATSFQQNLITSIFPDTKNEFSEI
jgi:hypothetical protein